MRRHTLVTALAALTLAPALVGWTSVRREVPPLTSRIWVSGTSTVRSFKCAADSMVTHFVTEPATSPTVVLTGDKAVRALEIVVEAPRLNCNNGTMNEHMRKAIKAEAFPHIVFRMTSYDIAKRDGGATLTAQGTLNLGGVERNITVTGDATLDSDGGLRVAGTQAIKLSDYKLKAPSLMLGTMKVGDVVTVAFDLHLGTLPVVAMATTAR